MRIRHALIVSTAIFLLAPGVAARAAGCPMLSDPAGDVRDVPPSIGIPDEQLDIRSADIAGNKTTFATEIRLYGKDLSAPDPESPGGRIYVVIADIGTGAASAGPWIGFNLILDPVGGEWDFASATYTNPERNPVATVALGDASGYAIDDDEGRIRVWATYETFAETGTTVAPGMRVRRLWAFASRYVTATPQAWTVDSGRVSLGYRMGDRGCIPIGR